MLTKFKTSRSLQSVGVLLAALLLAVFASTALLRGIADFLIVEDSLERATAIVSLGGHTPVREIEAAKLYHAGWASQVIIVRPEPSAESEALRKVGIKQRQSWELSREVLIQQGVPEKAILAPGGEAGGTLEELQAVYSAISSKDAPVILVTSKNHTRRTRLTWRYVSGGHSQPIVRAASGDPFDPSRWWRHRRFVLAVVREYLGLVNYYTRFAVAW